VQTTVSGSGQKTRSERHGKKSALAAPGMDQRKRTPVDSRSSVVNCSDDIKTGNDVAPGEIGRYLFTITGISG
jgi:hypothetical protein